MKNKDKSVVLQGLLSNELLGEIPLFFTNVEVSEKATRASGKRMYQRYINVRQYQTSSFESRGYHKAVSKIL